MSSSEFKTEQESFWAGEFGSNYIERNHGENLVASNIALFSRALKFCGKIQSTIEFGANIGLNLCAMKILYPKQRQYAIEINSKAAILIRQNLPECKVFEKSILDFETDAIKEGVDCVIVKGVLIHIKPENLNMVYSKICTLAKKYILVCEYYNPTPVTVHYRGHNDRLFKRDFAGEILEQYKEFELLDYGFVYHRDPAFPQDDLTWFLLERKN